MSSAKIKWGTNYHNIACTGVTVGWKNNTQATPNANGTSLAEVHTNSYENPTYTLQGVHLIQDSGYLAYSTLLAIAKTKYDGTSTTRAHLVIDYGDTTSTLLTGSDGSTTEIPVIITGFNFPIQISDGSYSGRYLMIGSITLQETG